MLQGGVGVAVLPDGVVIRVATDQDLRTIVAQYAPGGGDTPWHPFSDIDRIRRLPRKGLLIVEKDGHYVGFLFWYEGHRPWFDRTTRRYARISDLYLHPAFQGSGFGLGFLREALCMIRAVWFDTVFLASVEVNARARHLYETEGFAAYGTVVRYRLRWPRSPVR